MTQLWARISPDFRCVIATDLALSVFIFLTVVSFYRASISLNTDAAEDVEEQK